MNILLVDDEPLARLRLQSLLQEQGFSQIRQAADAESARQLLAQQPADLLLLDIEMPGDSGLELAKQLSRLQPVPKMVFVTAHAEFALEAFEVAAQGYLLKPVRQDKLKQLLQRLQLERAPAEPPVQARRQYLWATQGREQQAIPVNQILFFIADQKYTRLGYWQGASLIETLIDDSLKELEQEFEPDFIRIHRNALVALNRIQLLERKADGSVELKLAGSEQRFEISRRHLPLVRQKLQR